MVKVIRTYYKEEYKLHKKYINIYDKVNGEYKRYHTNRQLNAIYNCIDGKIEGEYKSYYENGQLEKTYRVVPKLRPINGS